MIEIFHGRDKITTHKRSFDRYQVIEDPKHIDGILATKRRALTTKLIEAFQSMGEAAKQYLDRLIQSDQNVPHHIGEIMKLAKTYGKTETLSAIHHALRFNALGAPYLKNIIHQERSQRGLGDPLPLLIPRDPTWEEISLSEADLALYDQLFNGEDSGEGTQNTAPEKKAEHEENVRG
jgi:hypothetical protein